jgi:hypothetical protein
MSSCSPRESSTVTAALRLWTVPDLVGVVIAGQDGEGVAVDADEIAALHASGDDLTLPGPSGGC